MHANLVSYNTLHSVQSNASSSFWSDLSFKQLRFGRFDSYTNPFHFFSVQKHTLVCFDFFQKINAHLALLYTYLSWYVGTRLPTFSFPFLTNKCNQFPVSNRILQMPFDNLPKKVATESEKKSEQTLCNDEHQVLVTNSSASVAAPRF